jgi:host factor-I protein
MAAEQINLQDAFLNQLRIEREQVNITTMNGFKIKCRIKGFDKFSILVDTGDSEQIIFKHSISTIAVRKEFTNKLRITPATEKKQPETNPEEK